MFLAPIVLFTYNRLWHTRQTIEALRKNDLAVESELIILSDGPRNENARIQVEEVRQYLKTIVGFKRIQIHERKENRGLANSIIDGVTKTVNEYGRVIVLEDYLLTSPFFLRYMNEALNLYEQDDRVISIHGHVFPLKTALPETFFIKGADCLGWATWKRGWDLFENNGALLLKELKDRNLTRAFDFNNAYPYTNMLINQIEGKVGSWAIRWYASAFLRDKLTLYPGRSLVFHNGGDGSGTNSGVSNWLDVKISQTPIQIGGLEITESVIGRKAFEEFYRMMKGSFGDRLKQKIRKVLCR